MPKVLLSEILSSDEKKKRYSLLLAGSAFRPAGGGQPGDRGEVRGENFLFRVTECEKHDEGVAVFGTLSGGTIEPGTEVEERIDLNVREAFSRMHTGEHILSRVLERKNPPLRVHKVAIAEDESTIYLEFPGEVGWEMLFSAEDEANVVVARNLPVETLFLGRDEAEHLPGIKGNWGRIAGDTIRVVKIPGFDTIACSGSHVSATGEVGDIFVTGFRGSAPEWEIKFAAEGRALRNEYSRTTRRLVRSVGCPLERLEDVVAGLREENASLAKMLEKAAQLVELPWEVFSAGGMPVFTAVVLGAPKEMVTVAARKCSDAHPDALVLLLLPDQEKSGGTFLFYRGSSVSVDFSRFLKESPSLEARGGGRNDWLNGSSPQMRMEEWLKALGEFLKKTRP